MKHYVCYHNQKRMNYASADVNRCAIYTKKRAAAEQAATYQGRIWLIGGIGKPRQYSLSGYFKAERVDPSDHDEFDYKLSGTGILMRPEPDIGNLPWFKAFLTSQQNFSLGFREIKEAIYISELEQIKISIQI